MINIAVVGATGRMGRSICTLIANQSANQSSKKSTPYQLSFVCSKDHHNQNIGSMLAIENLDLNIFPDLSASTETGVNFDVVIDFTAPEASIKHLEFCKNHYKAMVIGTTGFSQKQIEKINQIAQSIPVVFAPNMSIGVNLVFKTIEFLASVLDESFDAEITEAHHNKKVDAPSGTALKMGQIIAKARGVDFDKVKEFRKSGTIGKRKVGDIGFSAIRAGDIVGNHSVIFATDGEIIELTHRSSSRNNYAKGAILAAQYCAKKIKKNQVGLFDMTDVLDLKKINV